MGSDLPKLRVKGEEVARRDDHLQPMQSVVPHSAHRASGDTTVSANAQKCNVVALSTVAFAWAAATLGGMRCAWLRKPHLEGLRAT